MLTDDAWLTMPPQPYEYQGPQAIARFLNDRAARRGANYRLVATRANGQPAFGCYLPDSYAQVSRAYGLMVLVFQMLELDREPWWEDSLVVPPASRLADGMRELLEIGLERLGDAVEAPAE